MGWQKKNKCPASMKMIFCLMVVLGGYRMAASPEARPVATSVSSIRYIHMASKKDGWAWADGSAGFRVLRTTSGGENWEDVTPYSMLNEHQECEFPDSKTAWISTKTGLLLTKNGGKTWTRKAAPFFSFMGGSQCRFLDAEHGVASTEDAGAGSAYYTFFDTKDGGLTWKPVIIVPPETYADGSNAPGTVHLSNICGDRMGYYPPGKVVIVCGDLGDETPKGAVRLLVSSDLKSWRNLQLPLPLKYHKGLVEPCQPVFFDKKRGLLPVQIMNETENAFGFGGLLFYETSDGGENWTARGGPSGLTNTDYHLEMVSPKDIYICENKVLLVSHNGAKSWQVLKPNVDFGRGNSRRYVTQMNFADAPHGWIVIADSTKNYPDSEFIVYRTENGGQSWWELPLKVLH
jgi:photosystem II stability/assembly factor-like uncharacterized protein